MEKFLKANNQAEELIKKYVIANASDTLREKILKGTKNIGDCFNFIKGEAKKQAISGCACMTDEEVFGLAIHYFEEDSIKAGATVSASIHVNKLGFKEDIPTDTDDIEIAKPVAPKKAKPKKEKKEPEYKQMSLFDLEF